MNIDFILNYDMLTNEDILDIFNKVSKCILINWEDHPSYNGQPFLGPISVYSSLISLNLVKDNTTNNTRGDRVSIDVSIAHKLLSRWEDMGVIKIVDTELKDYIIV